MQMMTWQSATRKHMTWQRWRITGGHLAHRIRGVTTWTITLLATTLTFSPADALFLEHKVHNSSSSLHLCTRKIIGHAELCKRARRCNQLPLKVVFTVCPAKLYP